MASVSIIIPVFNAEDYLEECLDSVVNQTLKDIEIICVNDGSEDNSLEILNNYAKNDKRFVIISQENQGQGVARNKGLDLVKSDYFCFLDSDDKLELDAIEKSYNLAKDKDLDFVMFRMINFDDDKEEFYKTPGYDMYFVYNKIKDKVFNYKDLGELIFYVSVSPANKLFKSKFVFDSGVKFPKNTFFEDNVFFWRLFFNAKRIFFTPEYFYIRRVHSKSTTGFGGKHWVDAIDIYNQVWDIFKEFGHFDEFKSRLYNNKIVFALFRLDNIDNEYKDSFLNYWRKDLIYIRDSHHDFTDILTDENRRIFDLVLSSKNHEEFELYRNIITLSSQVKQLNDENRNINESFSNLLNINKNLLNENRKLKNQNKTLNTKLNKEINKSKKQNKKIKNLEKFNHDVLSSNSWKMTSIFRNIGKYLK